MTCRLLVALVTLALLPVLLATAGPVSAGPAASRCDYVPCENAASVNVVVPTTVERTTRARVRIMVRYLSGAARPTGTVAITVKRVGGGLTWTRTRAYTGRITVRTPRLRKTGRYRVTAVFTPEADSGFRPGRDAAAFRVVR
ncbi:hypothetical protein [Nocardioides lijunqiniae]|uniref:hypothetical protein n=1 Tax=Nocardioides lijunqiniae TaxID=2760832 RepID=UPI00187842AA|nr:hypothetical protein [Nocardioides lijunqiniae]